MKVLIDSAVVAASLRAGARIVTLDRGLSQIIAPELRLDID